MSETNIELAVPTLRDDWTSARGSHLVEAITSKRRRMIRGQRPAVLVAAVIVILAVAGSGLAVGLNRLLGGPPQPLSSRIDVASAGSAQLQAWNSDRGICLDVLESGTKLASACGFPVKSAPPDQIGQGSGTDELAPMTTSSASGTFYIAGIVASDVASVAIKLSDGTSLTPRVYAAPAALQTPVKIFFTTMPLNGRDPSQIVTSYLALDAQGKVVGDVPAQ
jgi:hypothetical protein